MAVILSSSGQVKPGRYTDFLSQSAEASKLYQRLGAKPPRLMTAGLAGDATGTWVFSIEFDDLDSFGAQTDEFGADPEAQGFLMRLQDPSSPNTLTSVVAASEIPLRESKGGRGPVIAVFSSKAHPGGLERSLELGDRANAFAEKHGAVNARLFNLMAAGIGTGLHLAIWEFDSMRGWAQVMGAFATEPEGQAIAAMAAAADAPNTLVFDAVYNEIPI